MTTTTKTTMRDEGDRGLTSLPFEIIYLIASYLRPDAQSSIHPPPHASSLDTDPSTSPPGYSTSMLSLAYTNRKCYFATLPSLYNCLILPSTRQVRLLAESLTQRYVAKTNELQEYNTTTRQLRHLFLPNDGMLMNQDQLSDQAQWAPSLRAIFANADMLDSILISSRTDGAAMSEFFADDVRYRPKRMTVLNFFSSPPFSLYNLKPLSHLTHLNLINLIPRDAILNTLTGTSHHSDKSLPNPPLTHLRLSQLHHETLHDFGAYIQWRRASEEWDKQSSSEKARRGNHTAPTRPQVPARRFEAQETLYTLATSSKSLHSFKRLSLELNALPPLPEPENVPLLEDNDSTVATSAFGQIGDDVDGGGNLAIVEEAERTRTAFRDAYWIDVRDGKEALRDLFLSVRGTGDTTLPTVDIRVVSPRPGGWNRMECRREFDAQVAACQGAQDTTCFEDPDVFWLGEHRPWLSYEGRSKDEWCSGGMQTDWHGEVKDGCWWSGLLPRYNAGRAVRRGGA